MIPLTRRPSLCRGKPWPRVEDVVTDAGVRRPCLI
jgi:hypothetical protein